MATKKRVGPRKKVLVVDDHPILRQGLGVLIQQQPDLEVCAEAEGAADAMAAIDKSKPDIAIVDISLKDTSGIDLIRDIHIRHPRLPVLVLSMHHEFFFAEHALKAGARGYVTKGEAGEKLMAAIRQVLSGDVYLSAEMADRVISRLAERRTNLLMSSTECLSDRELQVFELIGEGQSTSQIAETLRLSSKTIESHRENIKRKLKLKNASQLLQHAVQWTHFERGG